MQSLGLAAWLVAALLLAVGIARAADPAPDLTRKTLRWRALAGVAGLLLLAGGLSAVAPPAIWPLASGLGGLVGDLQSNGLAGLASALGAPVAAAIAEAILAGVARLAHRPGAGPEVRTDVVNFLQFRRPAAAAPRMAERRRPNRAPSATRQRRAHHRGRP